MTRYKPPSVVAHSGYLAVKFTLPSGKRVLLTGMGRIGKVNNKAIADKVCVMIKCDIDNNVLDTSLQTYKDFIASQIGAISQDYNPYQGMSQIELFTNYVRERNISPTSALNTIYRKMPEKFSNDWLLELRDHYSASTYNKLLSLCRGFEKWVIANEIKIRPIYSLLSGKKRTLVDKQRQEKRKPFTLPEIKAIIKFILNPDSPSETLNRLTNHYKFYILVGVYTGMRPSEIIGLRPIDVDLAGGYIYVTEALATVKLEGRATYTRERKLCKAGETKVLPIPHIIKEWLERRCASIPDESLIFTAPNGSGHLDDKNFRVRCWKPLLDYLGIPYRVPYALRHSFASHCVNQGIPLTEIAKMLGHSSLEMLSKTYGQSLNQPKLPNYD